MPARRRNSRLRAGAYKESSDEDMDVNEDSTDEEEVKENGQAGSALYGPPVSGRMISDFTDIMKACFEEQKMGAHRLAQKRKKAFAIQKQLKEAAVPKDDFVTLMVDIFTHSMAKFHHAGGEKPKKKEVDAECRMDENEARKAALHFVATEWTRTQPSCVSVDDKAKFFKAQFEVDGHNFVDILRSLSTYIWLVADKLQRPSDLSSNGAATPAENDEARSDERDQAAAMNPKVEEPAEEKVHVQAVLPPNKLEQAEEAVENETIPTEAEEAVQEKTIPAEEQMEMETNAEAVSEEQTGAVVNENVADPQNSDVSTPLPANNGPTTQDFHCKSCKRPVGVNRDFCGLCKGKKRSRTPSMTAMGHRNYYALLCPFCDRQLPIVYQGRCRSCYTKLAQRRNEHQEPALHPNATSSNGHEQQNESGHLQGTRQNVRLSSDWMRDGQIFLPNAVGHQNTSNGASTL